MRVPIKAALLTLAFAGSFAAGNSAVAQVTVGVNVPVIAYGYNDGYWDRDHNWHAWHNRREAAEWRAANRDHYYAYRHDRNHSDGWREERWWDEHH